MYKETLITEEAFGEHLVISDQHRSREHLVISCQHRSREERKAKMLFIRIIKSSFNAKKERKAKMPDSWCLDRSLCGLLVSH